MIGPAILAIEGMMGKWDDIAGDLKSIKEATQGEDATLIPLVQGIQQNAIVTQWNDLYTLGKCLIHSIMQATHRNM